MIDIVKRTPEVYSRQSRDYQTIARVLSAVFNNTLLLIDNMNSWKSTGNYSNSYAKAETLNFNIKHEWNAELLNYVVGSFKHIMRIKGTYGALENCINILLRAFNIEAAISEIVINNNLITISIPDRISDIGVVEDLFDKVIPAGFTYRIITSEIYDYDLAATKINLADSLATTESQTQTPIGDSSTNTEISRAYVTEQEVNS